MNRRKEITKISEIWTDTVNKLLKLLAMTSNFLLDVEKLIQTLKLLEFVPIGNIEGKEVSCSHQKYSRGTS